MAPSSARTRAASVVSSTRSCRFAFVAIEALIDDARRKNVFALLKSLNMLIEFGYAFDYSRADFRGWCSEVGFRRFAVPPLPTSSADPRISDAALRSIVA